MNNNMKRMVINTCYYSCPLLEVNGEKVQSQGWLINDGCGQYYNVEILSEDSKKGLYNVKVFANDEDTAVFEVLKEKVLFYEEGESYPKVEHTISDHEHGDCIMKKFFKEEFIHG